MSDIATETPAADGLQLSFQDIQNALQVIDFACEQGAFKGWKTIEQVLSVRNRLDSFVTAALAAQEAAAASDTETTAEG